MRKSILLLLSILLIVPFTSFAGKKDNGGMSKKEKKRIKQTLGEYKKNPESYEAMINSYKKKIDECKDDLKELEKKLKACKSSEMMLRDSVNMMGSKLSKMSRPAPTPTNTSSAGVGQMPTGLAYAVQLGYYEMFNITDYFATAKTFTYESVDGGNKYVVRHFINIEEAERFAEDVRSLGIKDAFVASYINGKRVSSEEAKQFMNNTGK